MIICVEPIRLQHVVNPDGSGHWQLVGGDEVLSSGANNCLPDALLAQLSQEERDNLNIHTSDDLRKATAEVIGKSPELTQKILQSAERLKAINKDVLMAGGNRYRINVGTTKDPSSSSHYRSQYVNADGGNEIDYLEVGSYDKDGNFQLKKCEVIERVPGGIYLVRFAESDKSTIGVLLAPGDDVSKDIQGYGLEPGGPSTAESGKNKRIQAGFIISCIMTLNNTLRNDETISRGYFGDSCLVRSRYSCITTACNKVPATGIRAVSNALLGNYWVAAMPRYGLIQRRTGYIITT